MVQLNRSGIYKITCLKNNKFYIGSAINLKKRYNSHKSSLSSGCHKNRHLQNAWNIYGENNFKFEIIEYVDDKKNLIEREQYWIKKTKCFDRKIGFNICPEAGSSFGVKRTEEFKNKIRQFNLNRSPESKQKVIDAVRKANSIVPGRNKGKHIWKNKTHPKGTLNKKFAPRPFSEQHLKNLRNANSKPKSQITKDKLSKYFAQTHYLINPKGKKVIIVNLTKFCRENNLNQGDMCAVSRGDNKSYKGWTRWNKIIYNYELY